MLRASYLSACANPSLLTAPNQSVWTACMAALLTVSLPPTDTAKATARVTSYLTPNCL